MKMTCPCGATFESDTDQMMSATEVWLDMHKGCLKKNDDPPIFPGIPVPVPHSPICPHIHEPYKPSETYVGDSPYQPYWTYCHAN